MPKVTFLYGDQVQTVEACEGETILKIALDSGIPMEHACGGNGFCTTCMCRIKDGMQNLTPRSDREEAMGIVNDPERLGCQSKIQGDITVEILE